MNQLQPSVFLRLVRHSQRALELVSLGSASTFTSGTPPTRPEGSFLLFVKEQRAQHPKDVRVTEITRRAAQAWRSMNDDEKQPYVQLTREAFERYREDLDHFKSSLSDFELDQLKAEKKLKREARQKRRDKKMKLSLGLPKRPTSAYLFYCKHKFNTVHGTTSITNIIRQAASEWRQMDESAKQPYQAEAEADRMRYERQMREFVYNAKEANMDNLIPRAQQVRIKREEKRRQEKENLEELLRKTADKIKNMG